MSEIGGQNVEGTAPVSPKEAITTPEPPTAVNLTPPAGFKYNPDILEDYDGQVLSARAEEAYQNSPIPSFEGVPTLDITPTFNPTGASDNEIYAHDRVPRSLRPYMAPGSEWSSNDEPVEMWRILERSTLEDGTGLVSSQILSSNSLGDVEGFDSTTHLASNHERRMANQSAATPFVSFSTDPKYLARIILERGFGTRDGRDSVVIRVRVAPGRVITGRRKKNPEVLLIGGVAPEEYKAAYSVPDFISQLVPEGGKIPMK